MPLSLAPSIHPSVHPSNELWTSGFFIFFFKHKTLCLHTTSHSHSHERYYFLKACIFFSFWIDMWLFTSLCNASAGFFFYVFLFTFRCTVELWVIEDRDVKWMEWNYINAHGSCNDAFIPLQMCSESANGILPNPANIETSKMRRIFKPKAGLLGGLPPERTVFPAFWHFKEWK